MTTYALNASSFTSAALLQAAVGTEYHLGLSNGSQFYGYLLDPGTPFKQRTDVATKEALTQYSSGQLIDRDLAFYPRVTDADFAGGGYQEVFIDTTKYFDSDLDPRIPGYLQLRPKWAQRTHTALTVGARFQVEFWNLRFRYSFGEANGNIYEATAGTSTSPVAAAIKSLDTDGAFLYAGTAAQLYRTSDFAAWTAITSSVNGTPDRWWVIPQGTNGYFAYYSITNASGNWQDLYKIDLTAAFPLAAAAHVQMPLGSNPIFVNDLVPWQNGIAIMTTDMRGSGFDVWYHDGTNLTRVIRVNGYFGQGICEALGNLYVAASAQSSITSPALFLVSGGTFQIVSKPGSPFPVASQTCGGPVASGQYVYWPVFNPSISGISSAAGGVVLQYDAISGATTHLPNFDANDYATTGGPLRTLAVRGESVGIVFVNGTTGVIQYQQPALGTIKYMTTGWLASSHIDFGTPGIVKRFRRIEVHHSPLAVGEAILVEAFVDTDPLAFTTALAPVPATATVSNSTLGSVITSMTFGADTIGKTLYFALKLTSGTSDNTTPRVSYVSVEVGGTWSFEFTVACTAVRRTLADQEDQQGVSGKDLAYMLLLAYENGQNVSFYHRNGSQYTCAIETLEFLSPSPQIASEAGARVDEEYLAHVVLRQVS